MAGPDSREIIFTMGEQITTNSISKDIQLFRDLLGSHPRLQPYSCATYVDDVPMHVWEGIGLNSDDLDTVRSWLREARIREVRDIFESAQEQ